MSPLFVVSPVILTLILCQMTRFTTYRSILMCINTSSKVFHPVLEVRLQNGSEGSAEIYKNDSGIGKHILKQDTLAALSGSFNSEVTKSC